MADTSLKVLADAVHTIADDTHYKIQPDVKDIRDAICGPDGILDFFRSMGEDGGSMGKGKKGKKGGPQAANLGDIDPKSAKIQEENRKKVTKSASSIESILKKILINVDRIADGMKGGRGAAMKGVKASDMQDRSVRDKEKQLKELKNMSMSLGIVERLKQIKLKDLLFSKKKMKKIEAVVDRFKGIFTKFKSKKEADETISFANSAISMVKSLAKIAILALPARLGAKAIETIILGNGKKRKGLVGILKRLGEDKEVMKGIRAAKKLKGACTSLLIATLMLAGIAVLGIPAMLGALLLKGVIWLLLGTFRVLSRAMGYVIKGSIVMLMMSASIITFALGLGLMAMAVRGMKLKDVGIMLASIVGIGLAIAGIGFLAIPIAIGSLSLLMIGISLGIFALTMLIWKKIDAKEAMANIRVAVEGLREVFGLELGKGDENKSFAARLGGGVLDLAMAILNFGKTFFIMGSLLLAGAVLGILYLGLKQWQDFRGAQDAINNLKVAMEGLKEIFGLDTDKDKGLGGKLTGLVGGVLDLGITLLQAGKALVEVGILTIVVGMSVIIRQSLRAWEEFDPTDAMKNLETAMTGLKRIFGFEEKKGIGGKLGALFGGLLDIGVALMQAGEALVVVGVLTILTGMSVLIRQALRAWEEFDPTDAMNNLDKAMTGLKRIFGFEKKKGMAKLGALFGGLLDIGVALMQAGEALVVVGVLTILTGMSVLIKEALKGWANFDPKEAISHLDSAIGGLKRIFGFDQSKKKSKLGALLGGLLDIGVALMQSGEALITVGTLAVLAGMSLKILDALKEWKDFDPKSGITNMGTAINSLRKIFGLSDKTPGSIKKFGLFGGLMEMGVTMMNSHKLLMEVGTIAVVAGLSLKILEALKEWENANVTKAATTNMSTAINDLRHAFGLDKTEKMGFWEKFSAFHGGIFEMGVTMMNTNKLLREVGTIAMVAGLSIKIREALESWKSYPTGATANMGDAINSLKHVLGLEDTGEKEEYDFGDIVDDMFALGHSMMKGKGVLYKIGTIATAVGLAGKMYDSLKKWEYYKVDKAIDNVEDTLNTLLELFGLGKINESEAKHYEDGIDWLMGWFEHNNEMRQIKRVKEKATAKLAVVTTLINILKPMYDGFKEWENFKPEFAIQNLMQGVVATMLMVNKMVEMDKVVGKGFWLGRDVYASERFTYTAENVSKGMEHLAKGLEVLKKADKNDIEPLEKTIKTINAVDLLKATTMKELFKSFAKIGDNPMRHFIESVEKFAETCEDLTEALNNFEPLPEGMTGGGGGGGNSYSLISTGSGGSNVDSSELAAALAKALRAAPISVKTDISDVRLVVNGDSGRRVVITLDN